jgi:hypothetical protein
MGNGGGMKIFEVNFNNENHMIIQHSTVYIKVQVHVLVMVVVLVMV